jgi:hypothetical protein
MMTTVACGTRKRPEHTLVDIQGYRRQRKNHQTDPRKCRVMLPTIGVVISSKGRLGEDREEGVVITKIGPYQTRSEIWRRPH